ncbi:MAG: hypothetical protein IT366_02015 [Candidatus Hydrogenedentes bacterium]|nr:hypothetical protein [Candidatus Hydrogenedentota bacterium]
MMKKILSSALVALFMSSLLVGCGETKKADTSEPKEKKQSPMSRKLQERLGGQQQEAPAPATESQEQPAQ